jgi:transcription initiation factor TFIID subunit 2
MPGLVEMEPPEVPPPKEPTFSVIHQEVELYIDFGTRRITGHTELTIEPQSKDLKFIKLCSRGITVGNIVVESKYSVAPTAVKFRDPYDGFRVRESYGVEQHHIIRENIEDAIREPPEPNLVITLPKQMRVQPVEAFSISVARGRGGNAKADGAVETPAPRTAERAEEFEPFTISMDFTLEDTRHALHWAGVQDGDARYPHLYTTASSVPGLLPSFAFPCVGTPSSRCSWRLTIQCPRTLGDIGKEAQKGVVVTNGVGSRSLTIGSGKGVNIGNVDMTDAPEDDNYNAVVTDEEKDRELVAVCSGFMEDSDVCDY